MNAGFFGREEAFHAHGKFGLIDVRNGIMEPAMLNPGRDFRIDRGAGTFGAVEQVQAESEASVCGG